MTGMRFLVAGIPLRTLIAGAAFPIAAGALAINVTGGATELSIETATGATAFTATLRLTFGATCNTASVEAASAVARGVAFARVGFLVAYSTFTTVDIGAALPIATSVFADDAASWAAKLLAPAASIAAGVIAAFGLAVGTAIGAADGEPILARACGPLPELTTGTGDGPRRWSGAACRAGLIEYRTSGHRPAEETQPGKEPAA